MHGIFVKFPSIVQRLCSLSEQLLHFHHRVPPNSLIFLLQLWYPLNCKKIFICTLIFSSFSNSLMRNFNHFVIKILQDGRYWLQDTARRNCVTVLLVPFIQKADVYPLALQFCSQHFQFRAENVRWNRAITVFLPEEHLEGILKRVSRHVFPKLQLMGSNYCHNSLETYVRALIWLKVWKYVSFIGESK